MGRSNAEGALRLAPWLWNLRPNDRPYYLLFVECLKPGIPVCKQVGHPGSLRPSDTERAIPYLDEVALDLPDLVIVAGHIGYPWTAEMIALTTKYENVYIDCLFGSTLTPKHPFWRQRGACVPHQTSCVKRGFAMVASLSTSYANGTGLNRGPLGPAD